MKDTQSYILIFLGNGEQKTITSTASIDTYYLLNFVLEQSKKRQEDYWGDGMSRPQCSGLCRVLAQCGLGTGGKGAGHMEERRVALTFIKPNSMLDTLHMQLTYSSL